MDNQILDTISYTPDGHQERVSSATREHLRSAAKWARIAGIILMVFFIIGGMAVLFLGGELLTQMQLSATPNWLLTSGVVGMVFLTVMALLGMMIIIAMLGFANNMKRALANNDQEAFDIAMDALKRFWMGVLIFAALSTISSIVNTYLTADIFL